MTRFTSPLIVLLLCGSALAGCASDGDGMLGGIFSSSAKKADAKTIATQSAAAAQPSEATMTMDIESGVQQAQTERLAHRYDDAIHTLSQLMLVASDDPRVVGEYGKTLAEKGRAQDAVQFLTRATQLQPTDWSTYSALGVAYDQMGDQSAARMAYEHALKLNPNEASVLNNYALSRMLANDPQTAHQLIVRAQSAGGTSDPKIARNIELMDKLAPASAPVAEHKAAAEAPPVPVSAPVAINSSPLPPAAAQNAPAPQHAAPAKVVMQAVPVDPLAGPAKSATHEPTALAAKAGVKKDAQLVAKTDVKPAETKPVMSSATAKIDIKKDAKLAAKADVKPVEAKPVTSGVTAKADMKPDTKTATVKTEAKPVKSAQAADVKMAPTKTDAKAPAKPASKTAIPALRQTASAY